MDFDDLRAIETILKELLPFGPGERGRILQYVSSKLDICVGAPVRVGTARQGHDDTASPSSPQHSAELTQYETIAELMAAAQPASDAQRVLVAAAFLQHVNGRQELTAQEINKELKHLGHGVRNITMATNSLKSVRPARIIQVRKAGKTKQARKLYKVTEAGKKCVEQMVSEGVGDEG